MKKIIIILAVTFVVPFITKAQGIADALRFSQIQVQGTARAGAMGNAFGALGGDFTSVSINPAGLGLYRSNEFVVTPESKWSNVESNYYGSSVEDTEYKFTLSNMSYVSTIPTYNSSEIGLVSVNLGIGFNRVKDFNTNAYAMGNNVDGSYMDNIVSYANKYGYDPENPVGAENYYEALAWETYVMNYDDSNDEYWTEMGDAGYGQNQRRYLGQKGSIDEYSFAVGLNFNHKFYLGASYAMSDIYYRESWQMIESDDNGSIPYFNNYKFNDRLKTYGWGYNFKFGAIYKPVNQVRLGVSIHTPTYYRLHDEHTTSMFSEIQEDNGKISRYEEYSPINYYDYRLRTPMRTNFSGAFVIAKKGILSIDYELINYGKAEFYNGRDGDGFNDTNTDIANAYKSSGNLRVGGEYKVNNMVSLRAGYELQLSAYNDYAMDSFQPNSEANLNVYSGGIGYRSGPFFADVSYRYSIINDYILPYSAPIPGGFTYPDPQVIEQKTVRNNVLLSLGFRF